MDLSLRLALAAVSGALLRIPGPTMRLEMGIRINRRRRVALASAAGTAAGDALAMTAPLAGLGALALAFAALVTALKRLGAA